MHTPGRRQGRHRSVSRLPARLRLGLPGSTRFVRADVLLASLVYHGGTPHARLTTIHHACHIRRVLLYIQVFTFMHMGGTQECMEVRMIRDASPLLTDQFCRKSFNAAEAECFKEGDRQKILAVIESSFGDIRAFDKEVHRMLMTGIEAADEKQRREMKSVWAVAWRRRSAGLASKRILRSRATAQKSFVCQSTETKGDNMASNEVRPIGPTNDGLILEEAT